MAKELAQSMGITKNQLSVMLSSSFSPIKSNVSNLADVLGYDVLKSIVPVNEQLSILSPKKDIRNEMFPEVPIDVSNVIAKRKFNALELFAGAGGLDLALEQAGFNDVGLVEIDKHAADTLKLNRPNWNVINEDITKITADPAGIYKYIPKCSQHC